ncbi:hypothetical protein FHG87_016166 [Trinorchestia longiramus]|nr:hypothetical protein FHG87_016166 [Trinorchestia longiramus]
MRRRGLLWREDQKKQAYEDKLKVVQELKGNDKWAQLERRLNAVRRAEAAQKNSMLKRRRASTSQLPDTCLGGGSRGKRMMRPTLSAAEEEEAFHGYASALYIFMVIVLSLIALLLIWKFY